MLKYFCGWPELEVRPKPLMKPRLSGPFEARFELLLRRTGCKFGDCCWHAGYKMTATERDSDTSMFSFV